MLASSLPSVVILKNLAKRVLYFWANRLEYYTDHGTEHSARIESLLATMRLQQDPSAPQLNVEEVALLELAAWYHDIGNLCGREQHSRRSETIINGPWGVKWLGAHLSGQEREVLGKICFAHGAEPVTVHPRIMTLTEAAQSFDVRVRLLGALIRIADACDADYRRCPVEPFEILTECPYPLAEGIDHWEGHQAVQKVTLSPGAIVLDLDMSRNPTEAEQTVRDVYEDFLAVKDVLSGEGFNYDAIYVKEVGRFPVDVSSWLKGL